ncbi:MAG TPA: GNAT family N-acetyltransferase [Ktedonobacteraceae bacterium]|nr:GNAT family N-acetyltransferase [Ktedonobacteraceae bacterium]
MRIRTFRQVDLLTIVSIQQQAAIADGMEQKSVTDFEAWFAEPELEAASSVFVITDDDDELNRWGQSEALEGIEGEIVGYTVLQFRRSGNEYHFLCQGAVQPEQRRRGAGRALLICALNWARMLAAEFEFEAEQEGHSIYFEALLPVRDAASARLAARCEMYPTNEGALAGTQLYRRELYS